MIERVLKEIEQSPEPALPGCRRCGGALMMYEEPTCMICGWRDFTFEQPKTPPSKTLFDGARIHRARYNGDSPVLTGMVIDVETVKRAASRTGLLEYRPSCPYCESLMLRTETAKKDRDSGVTTRYICESKHRIGLVDRAHEVLTWID